MHSSATQENEMADDETTSDDVEEIPGFDEPSDDQLSDEAKAKLQLT